MIARARFADPNMDVDSAIVSQINRRERRAPIHRRQPAGIAVGEDIDRLAGRFRFGNGFDETKAMPADGLTCGDILIRGYTGNWNPA